jgi:hypothetical protein
MRLRASAGVTYERFFKLDHISSARVSSQETAEEVLDRNQEGCAW